MPNMYSVVRIFSYDDVYRYLHMMIYLPFILSWWSWGEGSGVGGRGGGGGKPVTKVCEGV